MMFSAKTYAEKATTAMPKPGKRLANIARLENTGCLRQASRFAHGSNNDGYFDMGNLEVGQGDDQDRGGLARLCCRRRWGQGG